MEEKNFRRIVRHIILGLYAFEQRTVGGRGLGNVPALRAIKRFVFSRIQPKSIAVHGLEFFLDPEHGFLNPSTYKPSVLRALQEVLRPGDRAIDLGANTGYFTCLMAKLVGERGRVIAFEPNPANIAFLKKNISANGLHNVSVEHVAVSDAPGTLTLHLRGVHSSLGFDPLGDGTGNRKVSVPVVRLDDRVSAATRVRLIKMDIIGSEPKALIGMKSVLAKNPHIVILTAFCPAFLRDAGSDPVAYLGTLFDLGFSVYDITRGGREKIDRLGVPELVRRYDPKAAIAQGELLCVRGAHQKS